jgi:hypothetical protein
VDYSPLSNRLVTNSVYLKKTIMKPAFIVLGAAALLIACVDHYLPCRSVPGLWGQEKTTVEISFAETVCSADSKIGIRFSDVADSRCPEGMYCIWAGEVRPIFDIMDDEKVIDSFEMNLGAQKEVEVNQRTFVFTIRSVTPDPPPREIKKTQYKVMLDIEPK